LLVVLRTPFDDFRFPVFVPASFIIASPICFERFVFFVLFVLFVLFMSSS
jgi:hypothetical protein